VQRRWRVVGGAAVEVLERPAAELVCVIRHDAGLGASSP
jgi:hypothetical protein